MGNKVTNLFMFLLLTAAGVLFTLYVGRDQPNVILYNFVFMGIMVFIYFLGLFGGMFRMSSLSHALHRASDRIKADFKKPGKADMENLELMYDVFHNRYLDRKMDNFIANVQSSAEGIGDVEEYINADELDIHVHKRLLEMVPDVFTSLGILGTFLGLVLGLRDFNPSSFDTMTTSVTSLVDGIKVAFLTSIYGVAYSIVYTAGMKTVYSHMSENLTGFLERFHAYVLPTAENESRNLLVASQKIQTDAMNKMAEQFSSQLADNFDKVITPTFQKMNSSLDNLVARVTECQEDAIRQILQEFLRQMNSTFKMEFGDFGQALNHLTQAQNQNVDFTTALYQSLSQQLNSAFESQERAMGDLLTDLKGAQTQFIENSQKALRENAEISRAQQEEYQRVVDYLRDAEKSSAKFWVACNQAMQKYLDAAAANMDRAAQAGQLSEELIKTNQDISDSYNENIKELSKTLASTYQTMERVRVLLSSINAVKSGEDVALAGSASQNAFNSRLEKMLQMQAQDNQRMLEDVHQSLEELASMKTTSKGKGLFGNKS